MPPYHRQSPSTSSATSFNCGTDLLATCTLLTYIHHLSAKTITDTCKPKNMTLVFISHQRARSLHLRRAPNRVETTYYALEQRPSSFEKEPYSVRPRTFNQIQLLTETSYNQAPSSLGNSSTLAYYEFASKSTPKPHLLRQRSPPELLATSYPQRLVVKLQGQRIQSCPAESDLNGVRRCTLVVEMHVRLVVGNGNELSPNLAQTLNELW